MSIADKLLQVNQVKQDIKTAIETKGIPMTNVAFTEYANKILDISGGGGVVDEYFYYSKAYYTITNNSTLFSNAWQDMKDSETVLFDIPLMLAAPNQEMGGMTIDIYVGTNGQLQALYDACANETIPPPPPPNPYDISPVAQDVYYVNNVATIYWGDVSGEGSFPIPLYMFSNFLDSADDASFIVGDLTPLEMGLGLVLAKNANVSIPNNNIVIQQGFERENENGIIISDSVTDIKSYAFFLWNSNNKPLIIPNSVTSIGNYAFTWWISNTHPLVIPNSVTSIEGYAFYGWSTNNQPLIIPDSVTSIGDGAFGNWLQNKHSLVIPNSVTSIGASVFGYWQTNNQPLVIPSSVTSIGYGAFRNWSSNTHPLVIPSSVTTIGAIAFQNWTLVPYIEIHATTPPTLGGTDAFGNQNNAPIYVPNESVAAYKAATNWVDLADRIFSINDK